MKKMRTRINSGSPVPFTLFVLHCSLLFSKDLKLTPSAYCKDRVLSFVMHLRSDCLLKMAVHKTFVPSRIGISYKEKNGELTLPAVSDLILPLWYL